MPARAERRDEALSYRRAIDSRPRWSQDQKHLQTLSILCYVYGGLSFLCASVPVIHILIGIAVVVGSAGPIGQATEGWSLIGIGGAIVLLGYAFTACMIYAGASMSRRKRYVFCFVTACLCGTHILLLPFGLLGVVLSVFTIIVLARPSVRELFDRDLTGPPPEAMVSAGSLTLTPSMPSRLAIPGDQLQLTLPQPAARQGDDFQEYRGESPQAAGRDRREARVPDPLRVLSVFYYIGAGLPALAGSFGIALIVIGIWCVARAASRGHADVDFGVFLIVHGAVAVLLGCIGTIGLFVAGRGLARRKRYGFCYLAACYLCLVFPLGTMLGLPTLVLLTRPSVKETFA